MRDGEGSNEHRAWPLLAAEDRLPLLQHRAPALGGVGAQVRLPRDTLERISYILGIYKALQLLLPDTRAADEWIRRPNEAAVFGGRSALDRMLSGNVSDLYDVRQYLDAQRG